MLARSYPRVNSSAEVDERVNAERNGVVEVGQCNISCRAETGSVIT